MNSYQHNTEQTKLMTCIYNLFTRKMHVIASKESNASQMKTKTRQ